MATDMDLSLTNPELLAAQQMLQQREELAKVLTARGMQPIQSSQPGVPVSPLQGIAQIIAARQGARAREETEKGRVELARKYGDWLDQGATNYLAGAPFAKPNMTYPGEASPPENQMERIRAGLINRNPLVQRLAGIDYHREEQLDKPQKLAPAESLVFPGGQRPNVNTQPLHTIPPNWQQSLPQGTSRKPNDPPGIFRMPGADGQEDVYQIEFEGGQAKGYKRLDANFNPLTNAGKRDDYYTTFSTPDGIYWFNSRTSESGKVIPGQPPRAPRGTQATPAAGGLPAPTGAPPNPAPAAGPQGAAPQSGGLVKDTADPTLQGNIAAAKAAGTERGHQTETARLNVQKVRDTTQMALDLVDRMVGKEDGSSQPHPGFSSYVGATLRPGARLVHGTPEADMEAILKQALGKAFLDAYDTLRGTGQITVVEGQQARESITRMDKATSEEEFKAAANDFRKVIRQSLQRAEQRAATPAIQGGPGTTAPTAPSIEDLVNKYKTP